MLVKYARTFLWSFTAAVVVGLLMMTFRVRPGIVKYIILPPDNKTEQKQVIPVTAYEDGVQEFDPLKVPEDIGSGPLSYVREKGYVEDLSSLDLEKLSAEELLMTVHSYPDNEDILCRRRVRMGMLGDGGWEICDDADVRPREPCIIYSFGINNDFSFDDDAAKVYGCNVYAFDPSMMRVAEKFDRSPKVHFYRIGLDSKTHNNSRKWPMYTMKDIRAKLGHKNSTIDIIKMDIEGSELDAIPEMAASGQLENVRQFLVEYHVPVKPDIRRLLPPIKAFQVLEKLGFRKFYAHKNIYCRENVENFPVFRTHCYEVHMLRRG